MQLLAIVLGLAILFIIQYIANRLMVLSPERLLKAATQVQSCNNLYGRQLLDLNRLSAHSWAETIDYARIVEDWKQATVKILRKFDFLHHAQENNDFRLPMLLLGQKLKVENTEIPDKFVFRIFDSVLQQIAKTTGQSNSQLLKRMGEQLEPNSPLAARFWELRIFLLGSGRSEIPAPTNPGHGKFALLSALHMSFGTNSRSRLLRAKWNTPRIILETMVYGAFQFILYLMVFSPDVGHRKQIVIVAGQTMELGFLQLIIVVMVLIAFATLWFLLRFRRYVHARKFHAVIEALLKAGVIGSDDLRAYGSLVLGLRADDGYPWVRNV